MVPTTITIRGTVPRRLRGTDLHRPRITAHRRINGLCSARNTSRPRRRPDIPTSGPTGRIAGHDTEMATRKLR